MSQVPPLESSPITLPVLSNHTDFGHFLQIHSDGVAPTTMLRLILILTLAFAFPNYTFTISSPPSSLLPPKLGPWFWLWLSAEGEWRGTHKTGNSTSETSLAHCELAARGVVHVVIQEGHATATRGRPDGTALTVALDSRITNYLTHVLKQIGDSSAVFDRKMHLLRTFPARTWPGPVLALLDGGLFYPAKQCLGLWTTGAVSKPPRKGKTGWNKHNQRISQLGKSRTKLLEKLEQSLFGPQMKLNEKFRRHQISQFLISITASKRGAARHNGTRNYQMGERVDTRVVMSDSSKSRTREIRKRVRTSLQRFLRKIRNNRRLLILVAPTPADPRFQAQQDAVLERVCTLGKRRVSLLTLLGTPSPSHITLQHLPADGVSCCTGLPTLISPILAASIMKHYSLTAPRFSMLLTNLNLKPHGVYLEPLGPIKLVQELEKTIVGKEKKQGGELCLPPGQPRELDAFLARFLWNRRLLVISAPSGDDDSFILQLGALTSPCSLALRHMLVLKLLGLEKQAEGVVEFHALNGSVVETEHLGHILTKQLRLFLALPEHCFGAALVAKDGRAVAWLPRPAPLRMILRIVDMLPLRQREMLAQKGMHCPEPRPGYYWTT
uniref:coiled-coil domain-containing protein 80-like isoform X2 n=1 Tax=Myxine glutinosa TaxID=7769 RepID=UPI00358E7724